MPQSQLFWIIGAIILVLIIILIVVSLSQRRRRAAEVEDDARAHRSPVVPAASGAEAAGRADLNPATFGAAAAQGGSVNGLGGTARETLPEEATAAAVPAETSAPANSVATDSAPADSAAAETSTFSAVPVAASAPAAAAPTSRLTPLSVPEDKEQDTPKTRLKPLDTTTAGAGASVTASPVTESTSAADSTTSGSTTPGSTLSAGTATPGSTAAGTATPGSTASAGTEEGELSQEEALHYPVSGLPGVPGRIDVHDATAEPRDTAVAGNSATSATPVSAVPGTVPLTGDDAVIEAPEHAHEQPEAITETPSYITDDAAVRSIEHDLADGTVPGTVPLTGEDAVIEAPEDRIESREDRTESHELRADATRVAPAVPNDSAADTPRDSSVLGGIEVDADPDLAPDRAATGEKPKTDASDSHRDAADTDSRLDAVKETVVKAAGTVADTAGTVAKKAAPVVGSAARTAGHVAEGVVNTLKDKLSEAQRRRWNRK